MKIKNDNDQITVIDKGPDCDVRTTKCRIGFAIYEAPHSGRLPCIIYTDPQNPSEYDALNGLFDE